MRVSVALSPTPTTSTLDRFVMKDPATLPDARKFSKARAPVQLKRVVRQRARPQAMRNKNRTAVKSAAGPPRKDNCGARAIAGDIAKTVGAAPTHRPTTA